MPTAGSLFGSMSKALQFANEEEEDSNYTSGLRGCLCRGILTGGSRYKCIRWARIVMVFLLVVVTVAWLFVDIEDLNIRQRYSTPACLGNVAVAYSFTLLASSWRHSA